jgi:hypothetical protein
MPPQPTSRDSIAIHAVYMRRDLESELARGKWRETDNGSKTRSSSGISAKTSPPLKETGNVVTAFNRHYRHLDPRLDPWDPRANERWAKMLANPQGAASSTTASSGLQASDRSQQWSTDGPGAQAESEDLEDAPMSPKHAAEREMSARNEIGAIPVIATPRIRPTNDRLQSGGKLVLRTPRQWWSDDLGSKNNCPESPTQIVDQGPYCATRTMRVEE